MGNMCNSSKQNDVRKDRSRLDRSGAPDGQSQANARPSSSTAVGSGQAATHPTNIAPTPAKGISSSQASGGSGDDGLYGTSYTNKKTKEYDLLHDIVKQTRSNFIDCGEKTSGMDEEEIQRRAEFYECSIKSTSFNQQSNQVAKMANRPNIFDLPINHYVLQLNNPGTSTISVSKDKEEIDISSLVLVLTSASISPADLTFIGSNSMSISSALEQMQIVDQGQIVKSFEQL